MNRARVLVERVLNRGFLALRSGWVVLGVTGLCAIARGFLFLPGFVRTDDRLPSIERFAPVEVWAAVWVACGLVAVVCVVCRRWLSLGVRMMVGLPSLWTALYATSWIAGVSDRGLTAALTYGLVTFLTLAYFARVDLSDRCDRGCAA